MSLSPLRPTPTSRAVFSSSTSVLLAVSIFNFSVSSSRRRSFFPIDDREVVMFSSSSFLWGEVTAKDVGRSAGASEELRALTLKP